jgi:hypothetical protein
MTADIINLRKARKAKQKASKDKHAAENRVVFGRSKAERTATAALIKLDTARLDGALRANPESALRANPESALRANPESAKRANPDPDDDLDPGSVS